MIRGILLAAGYGRRLGGPKALARLESGTFHEIAVGAFSEAGITVISVVNERVSASLPAANPALETRILNPDPDHPSGMFGSIRLGVGAAVDRGADRVLILPVDHPRVTAADIRAVADGLVTGEVAIPVWEGRRGHPVGLRGAALAEVLGGAQGLSLRDIVRRDPLRVVEVAGGWGVRAGVNNLQDLEGIGGRPPVK